MIKKCFLKLMFAFILLMLPKSLIAPEAPKFIYEKQHYEITTQKLIKTVEQYIAENSKQSKLSADLLVLKCDQYDINLKLVLAQAHVESHFGTIGRAVKTNSVFGVGALDDGKILNTYDHPNLSIDPYMTLLKKEYLVNKNENDLIYGEFKNITGKRYATDPLYERALSVVIDNIINNTNIDSLLIKREFLKVRNQIAKL